MKSPYELNQPATTPLERIQTIAHHVGTKVHELIWRAEGFTPAEIENKHDARYLSKLPYNERQAELTRRAQTHDADI